MNLNTISLPTKARPTKLSSIENYQGVKLQRKGSEFLGPCPVGAGTIALDPTFGSFTLIRTSFTLGEPVSLVKVFKLFRLEHIVLVFGVWTQ
jgi:hypothetical protein